MNPIGAAQGGRGVCRCVSHTHASSWHGCTSALLALTLLQEHAFPPDSAEGSGGGGAYGGSTSGGDSKPGGGKREAERGADGGGTSGGNSKPEGSKKENGGEGERKGEGSAEGSRSDQQGQEGQEGQEDSPGGGTIALVCGPPPMVRGSCSGAAGTCLARGFSQCSGTSAHPPHQHIPPSQPRAQVEKACLPALRELGFDEQHIFVF